MPNLTEEEKQLILDYQITFDTDSGRRVLDNLKAHCHYDVMLECDDAMMLSVWTGMRNVFLYINEQIRRDLNKEVQTESEVEDEPVD